MRKHWTVLYGEPDEFGALDKTKTFDNIVDMTAFVDAICAHGQSWIERDCLCVDCRASRLARMYARQRRSGWGR